MCKAVASQSWAGDHRRAFVTLTVVQDWKYDARSELAAFRERWVRRFGMPHAVWWREHQRRGAVHFHMLVEVTPAQHVVLARWVAQNWKSVGGGLTDVREWTGSAKRLYSYAMKEVLASGKEYQHELPEGAAGGLGRWWGVWGCSSPWAWVRLDRAGFCELRRRLRRWGSQADVLSGRQVRGWWSVAPPELLRGL